MNETKVLYFGEPVTQKESVLIRSYFVDILIKMQLYFL